jgi:hypothetical protein
MKAVIASVCVLLFLFGCAAQPAPVPFVVLDVGEQVETNGPETIAQQFAAFQQQRDYASWYDLFTPELQELRDSRDFAPFAAAYFNMSNATLVFERVLNETNATAIVQFSLVVGNASMRSEVELALNQDTWRVNAFKNLFADACLTPCTDDNAEDCTAHSCDASTGYRCKQHVTEEDCLCGDTLDCPSYFETELFVQDTDADKVYKRYECGYRDGARHCVLHLRLPHSVENLEKMYGIAPQHKVETSRYGAPLTSAALQS